MHFEGTRRKPHACIRASIQYLDSSTGLVEVSVTSFKADLLLQKELKEIVPKNEWLSLQQNGFESFLTL